MAGVVNMQDKGTGSLETPFQVIPGSSHRQLFVYTNSPFQIVTGVAARLSAEEKFKSAAAQESSPGQVSITAYKLLNPFRGYNGVGYTPQFGTKLVVEVFPSILENAVSQSKLETCVNSLLEHLPDRCAVWDSTRQLYRKGF